MSQFPSIFQRYDTEFTDTVYGDRQWIDKILQPLVPAKVLDIACGTGRSSWSALEMGSEVTGVDTSAEALSIFKQKAQASGFEQNLTLHEKDINQEYPQGQWDMIMLVGNSLGVIQSKEKLKDFIDWAYDHLNPGGSLILSQTFPENGFAPLDTPWAPKSYHWGDSQYERTVLVRCDSKKLTFEFRYFVKGLLIHEDIMSINYFPWPIVRDYGVSRFGETNTTIDFKFEKISDRKAEPYELFYQFTKAK